VAWQTRYFVFRKTTIRVCPHFSTTYLKRQQALDKIVQTHSNQMNCPPLNVGTPEGSGRLSDPTFQPLGKVQPQARTIENEADRVWALRAR